MDGLRDVYKEPTEPYDFGDWLFRFPEVGGEPLSRDNHVLTDSRFVLFPRDDVDADNKSIPEKTLPISTCEPGTMSQTECFPHLLKKQLELYALDWVKQYPDVPIKSIILYAYMAQYEQHFPKGSINIQYAVVFDIDETEEEVPVELNGNEWSEYRHKKITGEIPAKPYEKLLADTYANTCDDVAIIRPAAFKNVYREPPSGHYRGEWTFILKFLKTELSEGVKKDRPSWILYDASEIHNVSNGSLTTTHGLHGAIESDYPELQKHDNVFRLFTDNWYVKYNGKSDTIKDSKGMRCIAFLLDKPDSKYDPLQLSSLVDGLPECNEKYNNMSPEQLEKEGLSLPELPIEDMTQEEKSSLEDSALKLWESSKSGKQKDVEAWEKCKGYLDKEHGLFPYEIKNELKFILKTQLRVDAE